MSNFIKSFRKIAKPLPSIIRRLQPVWLIVALAASFVVGVESLVSTGSPPSLTHFDKVMHFTAYFGLAALWYLALPKARLGFVVGAIISYGIGIEIAQHIMGMGRTGSVFDALANTFGALSGGGLTFWGLRILDDSPFEGEADIENAPLRRNDFSADTEAL